MFFKKKTEEIIQEPLANVKQEQEKRFCESERLKQAIFGNMNNRLDAMQFGLLNELATTFSNENPKEDEKDVEIMKLNIELSESSKRITTLINHNRNLANHNKTLKRKNEDLLQRLNAFKLDSVLNNLPKNKKKLADIVIAALTRKEIGMTEGEANNLLSLLIKEKNRIKG